MRSTNREIKFEIVVIQCWRNSVLITDPMVFESIIAQFPLVWSVNAQLHAYSDCSGRRYVCRTVCLCTHFLKYVREFLFRMSQNCAAHATTCWNRTVRCNRAVILFSKQKKYFSDTFTIFFLVIQIINCRGDVPDTLTETATLKQSVFKLEQHIIGIL